MLFDISNTVDEINRKLLLCKIDCRKKGKAIIDDLLEDELQTITKYIQEQEQCRQQNRALKE